MRIVGGENVGGGPMRSLMRALCFLLTLLATLVASPAAHAGTYDVYSCRLPNGSPAPTNGWTAFAKPFPEIFVHTANACSSGGALTASLPTVAPVGMEAGWTFTPPPGTAIDSFEIFRALRPGGVGQAAISGYVATMGAWPPADPHAGSDEDCLVGVGPDTPPCFG